MNQLILLIKSYLLLANFQAHVDLSWSFFGFCSISPFQRFSRRSSSSWIISLIFFRLFSLAMATGHCYEYHRRVYLTPPHIGLLLVNCCLSALIGYKSRSNQETITEYWSHLIRSYLVVLNPQHPLCRNEKHCDIFLSINVKRKY